METAFTTPFQNTTFITNGKQHQTEVTATASPAEGSEGCFIDPQLAFIVSVSSGSLILVLLISVLVLTYKVISLKRQCQARRQARSNVDRVSGSDHWGTEQAEGGIVGPCETNLLLEEVRTDAEDEEVQEDEEEAMLHQSATTNTKEKKVPAAMQSSTSRDSCIDPTRELEDIPLVV